MERFREYGKDLGPVLTSVLSLLVALMAVWASQQGNVIKEQERRDSINKAVMTDVLISASEFIAGDESKTTVAAARIAVHGKEAMAHLPSLLGSPDDSIRRGAVSSVFLILVGNQMDSGELLGRLESLYRNSKSRYLDIGVLDCLNKIKSDTPKHMGDAFKIRFVDHLEAKLFAPVKSGELGEGDMQAWSPVVRQAVIFIRDSQSPKTAQLLLDVASNQRLRAAARIQALHDLPTVAEEISDPERKQVLAGLEKLPAASTADSTEDAAALETEAAAAKDSLTRMVNGRSN